MYQQNTFYDIPGGKITPLTSNASTTSVRSSDAPPEPAASKWHIWAQEEHKHTKTTCSSAESRSPKISHHQINLIQVEPTITATRRSHSSTDNYKHSYTFHKPPNEEQLSQTFTTDPPRCFCKKPAHRSYTKEYGSILECANYANSNQDKNSKVNSLKNKYTCGFHVHETHWIKLRTAFMNGETIKTNYSDLKTCPLYNFTFCTMFYVTNNYDKEPPTVLPNCFCGKPVIFRETVHPLGPRYFFACVNSNREGARKCSWKLEAHEVAFPRPKNMCHTYVDLEEYEQNLSEINEKRSAVMLQHPKPAKRSQHYSELLATLSAYTPSSTNGDEKEKNSNGIIDFESLKEKVSTTTSSTSSLVIPTSVLAKKQPILSLSSSTSSASSSVTSPTTTSKQRPDGYEELKIKYRALHIRLDQVNKDAGNRVKYAEKCMEESFDKLAQVEVDCKEELLNMSLDLEQESLLRQNCQKRLAHIEIDMVNLMNEKEKALEELAGFQESIRIKYGKEEEFMKCKVCFHRSIEYVLIPCYHFAYCQPCAAKLKECAICRRSITGIQKIYTC